MKSEGYKLLVWLVLVCLITQVDGQTAFTDVTESAGIRHQYLVFEGLFGGGICVIDLDNDGLEDLYLTSGMRSDQLYHNSGDGSFSNIFDGSGLEVTDDYITHGVAGADVNRDGYVDLFVTTINTMDTSKIIPRAKNLLFLNNGDLTFTDVTSKYGLDELYSFSTGAAFGDIDIDGYPDLFVGNYFLEYEGKLSAVNDATVVGANQISEDYLLLNRRGRYFDDVYEEYGLSHRGYGFGGIFTDFDNDADLDLYIYNDFGFKRTPNILLENQYPRDEFSDISETSEMDLQINAMAAAVGDYNADGYLDYFVTNIWFNWFMVRQGPQVHYRDQLKDLGMNFRQISWGANFADFDQDGDLDLFVANGDLNPNCTPMANFYFENEGGTFREIASQVGLNDYGMGRGSVIFDIENDGDMDLLVVCQKPVKDYPVESVTRLYRNDSAGGNWLQVSLQGLEAESHGLGCRVEAWTQGKKMMREIDGGSSSHSSQNSTIAHFGLGTSTMIDSVVVIWTGGKSQTIQDIPVNQRLLITEEIEENRAWLLFVIPGFLILAGLYGLYRWLS